MKKYKTTKKDFKLFKNECNKWIDKFGLKNWEIFFDHKNIGDSRANAVYNTEGRVATISLHTIFNDSFNDQEIKKCAFHEVCEILLGDIFVMMQQFYGRSYITTEIHRIIRILENTVFHSY